MNDIIVRGLLCLKGLLSAISRQLSAKTLPTKKNNNKRKISLLTVVHSCILGRTTKFRDERYVGERRTAEYRDKQHFDRIRLGRTTAGRDERPKIGSNYVLEVAYRCLRKLGVTRCKSLASYVLYLATIKILFCVCLSHAGQRGVGNPAAAGVANLRRLNLFRCVLIFVSVFVGMKAQGQFHEPSAQTIRLGEQLPAYLYDVEHHAIDVKEGLPSSIKLADYKDKLIILDFWASWCSPCIGSLNKLDSISRYMDKEKYVVIPVTYQNRTEITPTLQRYKWNMTTIFQDSLLGKIFPHKGIPHQVWIQDGRVVAIPKSDYATVENINGIIKGDQVKLFSDVHDRKVEPSRPMFLNSQTMVSVLFRNRESAITSFLPGYRDESLSVKHIGDSTVLYAINQPIDQLFFQAYQQAIFNGFRHPITEAVRWEINPELKRHLMQGRTRPSKKGLFKEDSIAYKWDTENLYCYELRLDGASEQEALLQFRKDLNHFFGARYGLEARIVKGAKEKYAVLRLRGAKQESERLMATGKPPASTEDSIFYLQPFWSQPHFQMNIKLALQAIDGLKLTIDKIVDSTGIDRDYKASFVFFKSMRKTKNIETIQQELRRYGMYLTIEEKHVPILLVRQKRKTH